MSEVEEGFKPRPKGMRAYIRLEMEVCCHELKMYVGSLPISYARDCVYSEISDYEYYMGRLCRRWVLRWPWLSSTLRDYYSHRHTCFVCPKGLEIPERTLNYMQVLIGSQSLRFDSVAALDALIAMCGSLRLLTKDTDS